MEEQNKTSVTLTSVLNLLRDPIFKNDIQNISNINKGISATAPDERAAALVLELGNLYRNSDADKYGKLLPYIVAVNNPKYRNIVYSPEVIASMFGYDNDKDRSAVDKLLDDWGDANKQTYFQDYIRNSQMDWDLVKKSIANAMKDRLAAELADARRKSVDPSWDEAESVWDWLGSALMGVLTPRYKEGLVNGRYNGNDYWGKVFTDLGLDAVEGAAMNVPGSGWVSGAGKVVRKIPGLRKIPGAIGEFSRSLGDNMFTDALRSGGQMAQNLAGNAVVPFATEVLDNLAYDENSNMDDRADFSIGDAAIGTLVNQMVNRGLFAQLAPAATELSGSLNRGGASSKLRSFLQHLGESRTTPGDEYAMHVRDVVANSPVIEKGTGISPGMYSAARKGDMGYKDMVTPEEFKSAQELKRVLDAIDNGEVEMTRNSKGARELVEGKVNNRKENMADPLSPADTPEREKTVLKRDDEDKNIEWIFENADLDSPPTDAVLNAEKQQAEKQLARQMEDELYARLAGGLAPEDYMKPVHIAGVSDNRVKEILQDPRIINYATWHGTGPGVATRWEKSGDILNQAIPAYVINKLGKQEYTKRFANAVPGVGEALEADQVETHAAPEKRRAKTKAGDILKMATDYSGESLDDNDRKWLQAIAENPDIVKVSTDTAFKNWWLTRGMDLLRDTQYFRPAFTK